MRTTTVVIGAGHAGLAMSRRLTERSIDHVVIERGEVANSWRTERWDSLRLLTPNWLCALPGAPYDGPDPDGYLATRDVIDVIARYASAIGAPVQTRTTVLALRPTDDGFEVVTDRGTWWSASVVVASGWANVAAVPPMATVVPESVATVTPMTYRSPAELDERGVLVVGASATGVQLADEIARSGRSVTLAVGEHVRLPRCYRGRDIFWWLATAGVLDERYDEVDDLVRARHVPSPQLIGSPEHRTVDLAQLAGDGVRLVGRLAAIADGIAQFSGGLANVCRLADLKLVRLLDRLDGWAAARRIDGVGAPERFAPIVPPFDATLGLDLRSGEIGTIVWATGYRPDHSWLHLPVFDRLGRIRHDGGVLPDAPGAYLLGGNLLRRRSSSFICGVDRDSEDIADAVHRHLDARRARIHAAGAAAG
jgi:putative flavoprotein involved in K+ transport